MEPINKELPPIRNVEELHRAMGLVRQRIKIREQRLEKAWEELPEQTIKATLGGIIPIFLQNRMAAGAWRVIRGLFSVITGKTDGKEATGWTGSLLAGARQLGFFTMLKFFFDRFGGKTMGK
jgi:hypothetical protein